MNKIAISTLLICAVALPLAQADDSHHSGKSTGTPVAVTSSPGTGMVEMDKMQGQMKEMQQMMERIQKTGNMDERQKLMQENMEKMHEMMGMMEQAVGQMKADKGKQHVPEDKEMRLKREMMDMKK